MRSILLPGEKVYDGARRVYGTYVESGSTNSSAVALFDSDSNSIVPLEGSWVPRTDDTVIGIVTAGKNHVYTLDIFHFGRGLLIESKFERSAFKIGDIVEAKVRDVEGRRTVVLQYPKVLSDGVVISVKPTKIPRVIGRSNTMVNQISELSNTRIAIGNNGVIWIEGKNVELAMRAIETVEREAHMSGLTERIRKLLLDAVNVEKNEQNR